MTQKKSPLPCLSGFWLSEEGVEMSGLFAYKHCSRDCHRWCTWRSESLSERRFSCANSICTYSAHYYFISTRCQSVCPTIPHSQVSVDNSEPLPPPPLPSCTLHLYLFNSPFSFFQSNSEVMGYTSHALSCLKIWQRDCQSCRRSKCRSTDH